MKRDMDLIRDLLLKVENASEPQSSGSLSDGQSEADKDIATKHIRLLQDAGYINCISTNPISGRWRCQNIELTWEGHEFLDTLRDKDRWEKTKGVAAKAGGVGIKAMVEIGKSIAKGELQRLGIPIG